MVLRERRVRGGAEKTSRSEDESSTRDPLSLK
jgi:hypothetical protein